GKVDPLRRPSRFSPVLTCLARTSAESCGTLTPRSGTTNVDGADGVGSRGVLRHRLAVLPSVLPSARRRAVPRASAAAESYRRNHLAYSVSVMAMLLWPSCWESHFTFAPRLMCQAANEWRMQCGVRPRSWSPARSRMRLKSWRTDA